MSKPLPYEVWFKPTDPNRARIRLGRYVNSEAAKLCSVMVQACITDGEVQVEYNPKPTELS